ncbi:hypothetical protein QBC35DRAFT_517722 [Podospora australis]|uniref:Uncharacterized protein n=1 Tax=Podospora australis TaxID=1536484 RepID=A0AAN7AFS6_9PEZI|nr:hypothetical protein QBC35DRAFT_517722 [Podospora australis]
MDHNNNDIDTASSDSTRVNESTPLISSPTAAAFQQTRQRQEAIMSFFWKVGAVSGAMSVALGAFGAHGLKKKISDPTKLGNWQTAAHYHMIHSVAILLASGNPVAAGLFTAGITMFSGSLYTMTLDTERKFRFLGPVTPVGGLCLIAGWLVLAFGKKGGRPPLRF